MLSQAHQYIPAVPTHCLLRRCPNRGSGSGKCLDAHCPFYVRPVLCYKRFDRMHDWSTCGFAHGIVSTPAPAVVSAPAPAVVSAPAPAASAPVPAASAPAPAVASAPRHGTYAAAILKSTAPSHIPKAPAVVSSTAPAAASAPVPAVVSAPAPAAASVPVPVVAQTRRLKPEHRHMCSSLYYGECCVCDIKRSDLRARAYVDPDCEPMPGDSELVLRLKAKVAKELAEKRENLYIPEFKTFEYTPNSASFWTITSTVCPACERDIKKMQKDYVDDHLSKFPSELERFMPKTPADYGKQSHIKVYSVSEDKEYDDGLIEWAMEHVKPGYVFVRYGFRGNTRMSEREKWVAVEEILRRNPQE